MYRSNQTRIKKEISSLLPGRGQTPRGRLSLTLAAIHVNSTHGSVAPRVLLRVSRRRSPRLSPLDPSSHITLWFTQLSKELGKAPVKTSIKFSAGYF